MGMSGDEKKILSVTSACHPVNHLFFKWLGPLLPFIIPAFNLTYTQGRKIGIYLLSDLWYIQLPFGPSSGWIRSKENVDRQSRMSLSTPAIVSW